MLKLFSVSPRRTRFGQDGDTIVEVLIAIAIVSLVLTTAYVISSKNTLAIQGNQERIQAQHLVESQIEALRAQGGLNTSGDCFSDTGTEASGTACSAFSEVGSGATYTVTIQGPVSNVYTVKAVWSSVSTHQTNDSSVMMYYRLQ